MCRSIKPLFNYDPPPTHDSVHAAALQFVRKVSGYHKPSKINEAAFLTAVHEITAATERLLASLETHAPIRQRDVPHNKKGGPEGPPVSVASA